MKRLFSSSVFLCILAILVGTQSLGHAQTVGPVVEILGKPDSRTSPPNVHAYVSVVDPTTGAIIDGLNNDNFSVQVSEEGVDVSATLDPTGVAVAMVIDRGGIARRGDPRIGDAVDLADSLLSRLQVDGSENADMVALIGIRGRDNGGLTPSVQFTDYDPIAISNEFDKLRTEEVTEVTPLYDGIDQAIEWITKNPDDEIQDKLAHRSPVIVVFSDGIDNKFSSEAHETIIINKCRQEGILLYAIRMEAPGRTTDADNLEALASQTNGIYIAHNEDSHDQVLSLFDDVVTQRQSYRVTFPLKRRQGDYEARIQVLDTPIGDGSDEAMVSSRLQPPQVSLTSPPDGASYTVPYSHTPNVEIPLVVELTFPDGVERDPAAVRYYRNGVLVATSTTPPFDVSWDATDHITQTEETRETQEVKMEDFTFTAEVNDPYLSTSATSGPVNVQVKWEPLVPLPEPPLGQRILKWAATNWPILLIVGVLAIGLVVLLVLFLRMKGELATKVRSRTTDALNRVTGILSGPVQRAPGKLLVLKGPNKGREFPLAAQRIKVGRDPQFSDFDLQDSYVSNPHFSVQREQNRFFITDEGSRNGTRLNGTALQPHKRVLLHPDAIIEAGQVRLQFRRRGGVTRPLGGQPGGQQAQQPRGQQPRRGGPTQQVPHN
jgi:hypothetical protein